MQAARTQSSCPDLTCAFDKKNKEGNAPSRMHSLPRPFREADSQEAPHFAQPTLARSSPSSLRDRGPSTASLPPLRAVCRGRDQGGTHSGRTAFHVPRRFPAAGQAEQAECEFVPPARAVQHHRRHAVGDLQPLAVPPCRRVGWGSSWRCGILDAGGRWAIGAWRVAGAFGETQPRRTAAAPGAPATDFAPRSLTDGPDRNWRPGLAGPCRRCSVFHGDPCPALPCPARRSCGGVRPGLRDLT